MSLQITLTSPKESYTAGSPVTGTVYLNGTSDVDVGQIFITFSGRCKSKVIISRGNNRRDHYRGRVPIFHFQQILFNGPRTLHPNHHSWDFNFIFPARCESQRGDRFEKQAPFARTPEGKPVYRFNDDPHQPLPASFMLPEQGWIHQVSGFVSYQLEAVLRASNNKVFGSSGYETVKYLTLESTRDVAHPSPQLWLQKQMHICRTMHLVPGYEDRKLTFREKMSAMCVKTCPEARFNTELLMPRVCVLGQALPLSLSVDHDIEQSTTESIPTIYLKHVKVLIEKVGAVRCQYDGLFSLTSDEDRIEPWDESIILSEWSDRIGPVPITERIDLRNLMKLSPTARTFSPSFSTFNLEQRHNLKVKVTVECAMKKFTREFSVMGLIVLPEHFRPPYGNPVPPQEQSGSVAAPQYMKEAPLGEAVVAVGVPLSEPVHAPASSSDDAVK